MAMQQYSVKPEQLEAVHEKVKKMLAEGRRLDGSKPVQSWQQLREENHSLKRALEEMSDLRDDYKRRYEFARQDVKQLAEDFDRASRENTALKAQLETSRGLVEVLGEFVRREHPGLLEGILAESAEPAAPRAYKPRKTEHKTPEGVLARRRKYYRAHAERCKEHAKRYYAEHKEEMQRKAHERYMRSKENARNG